MKNFRLFKKHSKKKMLAYVCHADPPDTYYCINIYTVFLKFTGHMHN